MADILLRSSGSRNILKDTISCYMCSRSYHDLLTRIMVILNLELYNCKFNFQHDFYLDVVSLTKIVYLSLISESCEHGDSGHKFKCSVDVIFFFNFFYLNMSIVVTLL